MTSWAEVAEKVKKFSYKPPSRLWGEKDDLEGWSAMTPDARNVDWHLKRTENVRFRYLRLRYKYENSGPYLSFFGTVDQVIERLTNESLKMVWYAIHEIDTKELELALDPDFQDFASPWTLIAEWSEKPKVTNLDPEFCDTPVDDVAPIVSDFEDDLE